MPLNMRHTNANVMRQAGHDTEPLPADHPLRSLDNALLTPHIAYVSDQLYSVFYKDTVADIAAFVSGSHTRVIG